MAMPTQEQISEMLVKRKMNVFTWSKARDYKCKTVYGAIKQWAVYSGPQIQDNSLSYTLS